MGAGTTGEWNSIATHDDAGFGLKDQGALEGVMMKSKERDKAGGTFDKLRGRLKEAGGALAGKESAKAKGQGRQAKGSARKKRGHLRDALRK